MIYQMTHKRTQKVKELTKDEYNSISSKQAFRNNFYFKEVETGESVVGVPIDKLIEKQATQQPEKPKNKKPAKPTKNTPNSDSPSDV